MFGNIWPYFKVTGLDTMNEFTKISQVVDFINTVEQAAFVHSICHFIVFSLREAFVIRFQETTSDGKTHNLFQSKFKHFISVQNTYP